jgi:UDP-2-acetamido-3-amino-2,3-dideoxy-glucuronate N-acetyltransferase
MMNTMLIYLRLKDRVESMTKHTQNSVPAHKGRGVIVGKNVEFGINATVWNYVVIGDNTKIGDNTVIGSFCDIGKDVRIGKDCCLQAHLTISNGCILEDGVFIAPNTSLLNDKYPRSGINSPPTIKKNAVIGGGVIVLPGVTIGEQAVVGGGSVVTANISACTVHKGLPNREIMSLEEYIHKREEFRKLQK